MKKLFLVVACVLVGWAVHADAMYWQLNDTQIQGVTSDQWTMARVEVYSDGVATGTYLHYLDDVDVTAMDKSETGAWFDVDMSHYSNVSPEYSFVLELVTDDLAVQAASAPVSYGDLQTAGKIVSSSAFGSLTPLDYSTYNMSGMAGAVDVPEPTSGLLMLLGASLLALRRRQA